MKKGVKFLLIIFTFFSVLSITHFSYAEMEIEAQEEDIIVSVSPNNPEPYQDTTITLKSYSTDLNKANITWQKGSSILLSGIGKTAYSFKASGPNTTIIFDISIRPVNSMNIINKRISISPSEIELLWEATNSYTPPFYKGKALPAKGGFIKAVAIPNTDTIKSGKGSVSYTWKNNDEVISAASGYNKNSYIFKDNVFKDNELITVIASSVDSNYTAEKMIEVPTYMPKVVWYKRSPTDGVLYNKVINSETLFEENEMTIVAEPYFLNIKDKWEYFSYNWKINGDLINTPLKKTELTVRPSSRGGYANISLVIEDVNSLLQKVTGVLKLSL